MWISNLRQQNIQVESFIVWNSQFETRIRIGNSWKSIILETLPINVGRKQNAEVEHKKSCCATAKLNRRINRQNKTTQKYQIWINYKMKEEREKKTHSECNCLVIMRSDRIYGWEGNRDSERMAERGCEEEWMRERKR